MVHKANEDVNAVTGFETVVPVQGVTKETKILFPEVYDVKVGTLESINKEGELVSETGVIVYLAEELTPEDSGKLTRWLEEVYGSTCRVILIPNPA